MFIDDTSEKKNKIKNHCPESDYESAGEVVFGRLVVIAGTQGGMFRATACHWVYCENSLMYCCII